MPDFSELDELSDSDLIKLKDIYNNVPHARYVFNMINVVIHWNFKCRDRDNKHFIAFAVPDQWQKHGTFLVLMQCGCYDLFAFTLQENFEELHHILSTTKKIDWARRMVIHAIHGKHYSKMLQSLETIPCPVFNVTQCYVWWMSRDEAKQFEIICPSEVYISKLQLDTADIINDFWPHKYDNSVEYIRTLIKMNKGYGLFTKTSNEPVAWVITNAIGAMGTLHTVDKHKRKGYASLIVKVLAKKLAERGIEPLGTVVTTNEASNALFKKLGFKIIDVVMFVENTERL